MRVALVNNMPDAACLETEQQFRSLLQGASDLRVYRLDGLTVAAEVRAAMDARYRPMRELFADPPDAVVITGTEPRAAQLPDEAYWPDLVELLRWAVTETAATYLSCLAAHAAMLALEGVARRPLARKLSGVVSQPVLSEHPVTSALGTRVAFPHSRLNEIPTGELAATGAEVLVAAPDTGWTVAAAERPGHLSLLVQGHPEYGADSLLREYRRDVRRYLEGEAAAYPDLPTGYLDQQSERALARFRDRALGGRGAAMDSFPYGQVAARLDHSWTRASHQLFAGWLAEVHRRSSGRRPARA